jgi:hypothetical protein
VKVEEEEDDWGLEERPRKQSIKKPSGDGMSGLSLRRLDMDPNTAFR